MPSPLAGPGPDPQRGPSPETAPGDHLLPAIPAEQVRAQAVGEVVAAFTSFYEKTAPRLVAFLRWQGASLPDAADCAQDGLVQCFQQWTSLSDPYPWCRTVTGRLYARRVGAVREQLIDDVDTAAGQPLLPTNTDIDTLENRHTLLALLDHLPPRQRQVLAWTYDGASTAEIAAALTISEDSVRSNLSHARATMRSRRRDLGVER